MKSESPKQTLRREIRKKLQDQDSLEKSFKSRRIYQKLLKTDGFRKARKILFYASLSDEVQTDEMIIEALRLGKIIALPRADALMKQLSACRVHNITSDLKNGLYGVREPGEHTSRLDVEELDLVIVPGMAFTAEGQRLGRGQGYYDRFLTTLSPGTKTIGLAYDVQMVTALPQLEAHDRPVDLVIFNE